MWSRIVCDASGWFRGSRVSGGESDRSLGQPQDVRLSSGRLHSLGRGQETAVDPRLRARNTSISGTNLLINGIPTRTLMGAETSIARSLSIDRIESGRAPRVAVRGTLSARSQFHPNDATVSPWAAIGEGGSFGWTRSSRCFRPWGPGFT